MVWVEVLEAMVTPPCRHAKPANARRANWFRLRQAESSGRQILLTRPDPVAAEMGSSSLRSIFRRLGTRRRTVGLGTPGFAGFRES
jgi:hypothetical protein